MPYRNWGESELWLSWKLVGYFLLGAFTFTFNEVMLPLGFAACMLFIHKSKLNIGIKQKAALLGLAVFVFQVLSPSVAMYWDSREVKISNVSAEELGIAGIWELVVAQSLVSEQARLHTFQTNLSKSGEINDLTFHVVERSSQTYVHSRISYESAEQKLTLRRSSSDSWLQFDQQLLTHDFFDQLSEWKVLNVVASKSSNVRLQLMQETVVNYHIENRQRFGIDGKGLYVIADEQLPVQGLWLSACDRTVLSDGQYSGCDNYIDYLLDLTGREREWM